MRRETTDGISIKPSPERTGPPTLTIDWDLYGGYLADSDLSDAQKRDLIETLWSLVVACVDLGFGIHPLQQTGGPNRDLATFIGAEATELLESKAPLEAAAPEEGSTTQKETA